MQVVQKVVDPNNRRFITSRTKPNILQQLQDEGLRPWIWLVRIQAGQRAAITTGDQREPVR